jgi:glutamine cyclotransferase
MSARSDSISIYVALLSILIASCIEDEPISGQSAPVHGFEVVAVYPHDPEAFTQGLVYRDGILYEGTGLYGRSALRETKLETGEVMRSRGLSSQLFGVGIAIFGERLVQLTWKSGTGLVWDFENLSLIGTFIYPTEGWGITSDGHRLIMSDGTSTLRFLDPETFRATGAVKVLNEGAPLSNLNELEYVEGLIYANVWETDDIAIISPETGEVVGWIDLSGLLTEDERRGADVLNGIAYDPENKRLLVTGKLWPKIFEIRVATRE